MKECCGTCKYNRYARNGVRHSDFYCGNEDSFEYGSPTLYSDTCDDYEEKEEGE